MCEGVPDTIAIDGPAASGKTSLGRALAAALGYRFLDTGLMYRAFTLLALRAGVPASDPDGCGTIARSGTLRLSGAMEARVLLGQEDVTDLLRAPEVEASVSAYSAIPAVRTEMVRLQQEFAGKGKAVLAGRDIGTVVLPDARVKLFLDASEEERARRRGAQAEDWGLSQRAEEARRDITGRDRVDSSRATSPLRPADDAVVIDTTALDRETVLALALEKVQCGG